MAGVFRKWALGGRKLGHWSMSLKGMLRPLLRQSLLPGFYEMNWLPQQVAPYHNVLPCHLSKDSRAK
jgi:hypothetical protein